MEKNIKHEKKFQQFTLELGEEACELAYARPEEDVIDFTHTFVPKSERGKGFAEELITTGLDYARKNNLKVKTTCPAVAKFIKTHPEYKDLLE
jgi:uncharacterized protein